ncbi:MAG TPA: bacillithiol system redox-active protein YtxJ [Crocinitomix sp.]|nr:bacillithiol system redox-active protein YtxJ [Crocinitomix sp.]
MGWFNFNKGEKPKHKNSKVNWVELTTPEQLNKIVEESKTKPVLIYKHSTRCSVSIMAKSHLDTSWDLPSEQLKCYYLDLLKHRDVSNQIAEMFGVIHQSPQVLIIKNGKCIYNASHDSIHSRTIAKQIKE